MHARRSIDRSFAEALPSGAAARMRRHVSACPSCLAYYEEQLRLHRALRGDLETATPSEDRRAVARALASLGRPLPRQPVLSRLADLLLWPAPALLGVPAVAVALLLVGGVLRVREDRAPVARIVTASGLSVEGVPADPGAPLSPGRTITIAPDGAAELALERGGRLKLYPGAALRLLPRGAAVELLAGRLWCEVDHTGAGFAVRTGEGEARVVGTSFVVERQREGSTEVRVMSGTVEVEDAGHRGVLRLAERQRSTLSRGESPAPASRYSPQQDRGDWEGLFRELGRKLSRGMKELKNALDSLGRKPQSP